MGVTMKKEKSAKMQEIQNKLKGMIGPFILCALILTGVWVIINYQGKEPAPETIRINSHDGSETPVVMENEHLKFTMDPMTTQFEVEVKSSGKTWYSNPVDADQDMSALSAEKGKLQSTLTMTYSITTGLDTLLNNYDYSIKNGTYEIEASDDCVKVNYSIGDIEKEFVIPPVCREADMDQWIEGMTKEAKNIVKQYYKKYDINKLSKRDAKDKDSLLEKYPLLETEVLYILRDGTNDSLKKKMEQYFEESGYTYADYEADKELDNAEKSSDKPVFNVNMVYRLEGEDLVVEIPLAELEGKDEYPIYSITPLPFFGAGGKEDDGYLLVPEGGGAIINFNNGKLSQNSYYANLYGWDMALGRDAVVHNTRIYYNTFGISEGDDSFLCIMEEGVPYAAVQADISGHFNSYNYANVAYSITPREQYDVSEIANSSVYTYLKQLPDETLTQRYRFVDSGSYVDMAKIYQSYLKDKYTGYFTMNEDTQAPVTVEIVGAVDKVKQIVGVPVSRPLELTTYQEAQAMIEELYDEGFTNMSVKLSGWCNGGINQKVLNRVKTISDLGSKKDLMNTISSAQNLGVDVYLDGVTQYANNSNIFDGFFSIRDSARFLSKERAELFQYSAVTYTEREGWKSFYLLHPDLAAKMTDNLVAATDRYGAGVSFRDTGMDLSADYYKRNTVSRQAVMQQQETELKDIADTGKKIMINMGNDYAVPYSDVITNMDLQGSEYTILDEYVPFYQIALHGYVNYMGFPLNLSGDSEKSLLNAAEYGAGLYYTVMKESPFTLQNTLYTQYYGADYDTWHDRILSTYTRYNEELGHTFNQEMINHEMLQEDVSCTTYEDGTKVYVNYAHSDVLTRDGTVPARDYLVIR